MKIIILDGFTANPGDLDWQRLDRLGELTVYERTPPEEVISRCQGAEVIFTNKTPLSSESLSCLSSLKFIGILATGYNIVDIDCATRQGITVCTVPSYSTMSVSQTVFALILDITNNVAHYTRDIKHGKWCECEDFCYSDTPLIELSGKQLGIIGYGNIGHQVARIGMAFGMNVMAYTSRPQKEISPVVKTDDINTLFSTSDIISLHCPLTEDTYHIVNEERLAKMKPTAILINTSRGPLVDDRALADALRNGIIAGAGVDVLDKEPPRIDNPLLSAPNIRITPHISWATYEARKRLIDIAVENLECYLAGSPQNVVN